MKVGDLVDLPMINPVTEVLRDFLTPGMVVSLTAPTPLYPYQIATVMWADGSQDEFLSNKLDIINEAR